MATPSSTPSAPAALAERQSWLDVLPIPAVITRAERIVCANAAFTAIVGRDARAGESLRELLAASVIDADRKHIDAAFDASGPPTRPLRIRTPLGEVHSVSLRCSDGPGQDERSFVLIELGPEPAARRLVDALAWAAGELARLRDENAVVRWAVDVIHWEGFAVAAMVLDRNDFVLGPLSVSSEIAIAIDHAASSPLRSIRRARKEAGALDAAFARGRAALLRDLAPTDIIEGFPVSDGAILGPVLVEGAPFAVLAIAGPRLTADAAAAVDLFAAQIGASIANVRHHQRADARVTELESLQRALVARERMAALGEAAAVLAHEIRNPLAVINNAVGLLARKTGDDAALRTIISEETNRLEALVRDLLQLARPLEPRRGAIELVTLVRRAVVLLRERGERPDVSLDVCSDAEEVGLVGDAWLLAMVIDNLLRNALEASPRGGAVRVRITRSEGTVIVAVEDQGSGVAPGDALRIFEPFFTTRATGTGLGLAIVRRVVEAHGGTVALADAPRGARFEVVLPSV